MKNFRLALGLILLAGCGREGTQEGVAKAAYDYPALNVSSPPPAPPRAEGAVAPIPPEPPAIPTEISDSSGLQMEVEKLELIERLRAYAAQAEPDDPFAMTKEEIDEFAKQDNPMLY